MTLNLDRPVTASRSARPLSCDGRDQAVLYGGPGIPLVSVAAGVRAGARQTLEVIFAKSTAFQFASIECDETSSRCENRLKHNHLWENAEIRSDSPFEVGLYLLQAEDTRLHRCIALKRGFMRSFASSHALAAAAILLPAALLAADVDTKFHNAPASAQAAKNPYVGQEEAAQAGEKLYARSCLSCHGKLGGGTGNVTSLVDGRLDSVRPGEVFWFITMGDKDVAIPLPVE